MSTLGKRIKKLRYERGFTQFEMAIKLDMGRANYSHIENDRVIPSTNTLQLIADALYTTSDYLLGRTDDPSSSIHPPGSREWILNANEEQFLEYYKENCPPALLEIVSQSKTVKELVETFKKTFKSLGFESLAKYDFEYDNLEDMYSYLEIVRLTISLYKADSLEKNKFYKALENYHDDEDEFEYDETEQIPLVGTICAGEGLFAEQNIEDLVYFPFEDKSQPDFALRVQGDSMIDAGIQNGDIVFMRKAKWAEYNGQIVAAVINGENGMLKRMKWSEGSPMVELISENENFQSIKVLPNEVQVCGIYMGFFRPEIN